MFPSQKIINDISEKDYLSVDVLSKTESGSNILYKGILYNYHLTNDGGLESVVLRFPRRKFLTSKEKPVDDKLNSNNTDELQFDLHEYTEIPSTKLIIPYKNIENINLRLIQIAENGEVTD